MKAIPFVATIATLTTLGGLALAHGAGGARWFDKLDQNHDGKVTSAEADTATKARFTELDKNKDNVISGDELGARGGRMLLRADTNHDQKVTLAEMQAARRVMFARLDTNKDKVVTKEEFAAAREHFKGQAGAGGRGHCHGS